MSRDFEQLMEDIEAETTRAGPKAIAQMRTLEAQYRLASELIARRQAKGFTQQQLARLSGVNQSDISKIEGGRANPTFGTLSSLAIALGGAFGFMERAKPRPAVRKTAAAKRKRAAVG